MSFKLPALAGVLSFTNTVFSLNVYNAQAQLPSAIPSDCQNALRGDITCSPRFITSWDVALSTSFDDGFLKEYCVDTCRTSLNAFEAAVTQRCGTKQYAFGPQVNQSGVDIASALTWAYNISCQKDKAGNAFCLSKLLDRSIAPCDDCALKYEAAVLSGKLGNELAGQANFTSKLSSCKVPASAYPIATSTSIPTETGTIAAISATPTCNTKVYTAKQGDTCTSVAQANSIATDLLITRNKLDKNCGALNAGQKLCLGDACQLHVVKKNESCAGILALISGVKMKELSTWNPSINEKCDNLDSMVGKGICVSPPGVQRNTTNPTAGKTTGSSNKVPVSMSALFYVGISLLIALI